MAYSAALRTPTPGSSCTLALLGALVWLVGCPRDAPPQRDASPEATQDSLDEPPPGEPWMPVTGPVEEPRSGLTLPVPEGWQSRRGRSPFVVEARDPATGLTLYLGTWSGDPEALKSRILASPEGFVDRGTEGPLVEVAGQRPWISSRPIPGGLRVGWYFEHGASEVAVEAELPGADLEASWRQLNAVLIEARGSEP